MLLYTTLDEVHFFFFQNRVQIKFKVLDGGENVFM